MTHALAENQHQISLNEAVSSSSMQPTSSTQQFKRRSNLRRKLQHRL